MIKPTLKVVLQHAINNCEILSAHSCMKLKHLVCDRWKNIQINSAEVGSRVLLFDDLKVIRRIAVSHTSSNHLSKLSLLFSKNEAAVQLFSPRSCYSSSFNRSASELRHSLSTPWRGFDRGVRSLTIIEKNLKISYNVFACVSSGHSVWKEDVKHMNFRFRGYSL